MKKPTIATINIEGINTTMVVTPELRCLHPKEITDAYSEMIDALIKLHRYVKDNQPNYLLSSKYISLHEIEQALKKAGCE